MENQSILKNYHVNFQDIYSLDKFAIKLNILFLKNIMKINYPYIFPSHCFHTEKTVSSAEGPVEQKQLIVFEIIRYCPIKSAVHLKCFPKKFGICK